MSGMTERDVCGFLDWLLRLLVCTVVLGVMLVVVVVMAASAGMVLGGHR